MYNIYADYFVQPRGRTKKFLMVMKLTTLLLLFAIMQVSAMTYAQKVSLNVKNTPLSTVLDQISNQTDYNFFYTNDELNDAKPVNLHVTNAELKDVLQQIFAGQPLEFTIQDKNVVIKQKQLTQDALPKSAQAEISPRIITGKVINEQGETLPGVSIKIKGTYVGFLTNKDGVFTVSVEPTTVLQFAYIGYFTQEIPAGKLKNGMTIVLKSDIAKLDEVQIIAYGTTSKRESTSDMTVVDAKTIAQYPTTNVMDVLEGTVPGLSIAHGSGNPNSVYNVMLRGVNGARALKPLYIIDGIPYGSAVTNGNLFSTDVTLGNFGGGGGSLIQQNQNSGAGYDMLGALNPQDIESITVLKDADATAIYGTRGADGVILITTKKGSISPTTISATINSGVSDIARMQTFLNLQQYLAMRHEGHVNDKSPVSAFEYDISGVWDTTRYTDWQKTFVGGFDHQTNAQVGMTGGNQQMQYRLNGSYNFRDHKIQPVSGSNQTATVSFGISGASDDKKFTMNFSGGYYYNLNTVPNTDLLQNSGIAPDAPALYLPDGALNFQNNTFGNPLVYTNQQNHTTVENLYTSLLLTYKILKNLNIQATTGYNKQTLDQFLGTPTSSFPPFARYAAQSVFNFNNNTSWSIEPQLNYTLTVGKGKLTALLGTSFQKTVANYYSAGVTGYTNDNLLSSIGAGTTTSYLGPAYQPVKRNSTYGRFNYVLNGKYLFNVTGRNDGSSSFGANNRTHLFGAVGAGWIFSEENLVKKNLPFLSFGKIRGSYGVVGRDPVIAFGDQVLFNGGPIGNINYGNIPNYLPQRLANPDLKWESNQKIEMGLELQFLQGRIGLTANLYRDRSSNFLFAIPVTYISGFASQTGNLPGVVQNQGYDISLNTVNIRKKSFSWNSNVQFSLNRNKLLSYPFLNQSVFSQLFVIGQPIFMFRLYDFAGVNPQEGYYQFRQHDGTLSNINGPSNSALDQNQIMNNLPNFFGSVQNNITYKQFSLSFLFRFVKQVGRNGFYDIGSSQPGSFNANKTTFVLSRWQKPGDITNIQRFTAGDYQLGNLLNLAQHSTAAYGDASFVRLQNVAFSYNLPQTLAKKLGMKGLTLTLMGQNLLLISGYNGWDPETQSGVTLPPLRTVTAGLQITL